MATLVRVNDERAKERVRDKLPSDMEKALSAPIDADEFRRGVVAAAVVAIDGEPATLSPGDVGDLPAEDVEALYEWAWRSGVR